jgi:hypothetical protein
MPEQWFGLLMIGLVAGVAAGLFGIGGGVIIVPALTLLLGFAIKQAFGTSLAALLMPVSLFAVLAYYRAGKLRLQSAVWIALGILLGAWIGATITLGLDAGLLERVYGLFLLYMAVRYIEPRKWLAERRGNRPTETSSENSADSSWYALLLLGLFAGIMSGMFGIGGGVVIVIALVELFHFDQKRAVGTSLAALLPPVSISAVYEYYRAGFLEILTAVWLASGLVFGAIIGARIALGLPSATIKRAYGLFLVFVALRFLGLFEAVLALVGASA